MRTVHIQLVNGTRFTLDAGACATVGQLRDLVSSSLPGGQAGQPVRLVASGRLLRNDAESLESCRVVDGCIVHAMPVSCGMASASFLYGLFIGYLAGFWAMLFLTRTGPGRQYFLTGCLLGVMLHVAGPSLFDPVGPAPQPQPRGTDFTTNPPIALPPSLRGTTAPAGGR
ncbi:hypothetical protein FNF31_07778 [Cafeteria roenbergensis]|uniref:Ubiquitin-like domain-containing protein n=1 Tax=Cafeteria roenbergensis TaxID=33653 RepID=A0A5A8C0B5_CAFRO|nr:hypothetical protein FNF31_07778 [Cafeteria roenbergensis]